MAAQEIDFCAETGGDLGCTDQGRHVAPLIIDAVVVTYGDRWQHLSKVLHHIEADPGIGRVYLVDNAAADHLADRCAWAGLAKVTIRRMTHNLGSAGGFAVGIGWACEEDAAFILLLDDDNLPAEGAISVLRLELERLRSSGAHERTALFASRAAHPAQLDSAGPRQPGQSGRPGSFLGFHLLDLPEKLRRRAGLAANPEVLTDAPPSGRILCGPYGGLCLHRSIIDAVGLPDPRFILYADDYEFTLRMTRAGFTFAAMPAAEITDLDPSWGVRSIFRDSVDMWLKADEDLRVFYTIRNQTYLDATIRQRAGDLYFVLNRAVYMSILWLRSLGSGRRERYGLIRRAVDDGLRGRLGLAQEHPLP